MNRSFRIDDNLYNKLSDFADKNKRSVNWLVNEAVRDFISKKDIEEERWQETLQAIDSTKQGKVLAEKEVNNWLKTW